VNTFNARCELAVTRAARCFTDVVALEGKLTSGRVEHAVNVEPWWHSPSEAQHRHQVLNVGIDRICHARVLHLHRHLTTVMKHRAVHLALCKRVGGSGNCGSHVSELGWYQSANATE